MDLGLVVAVLIAIGFAATNGLHDASNAIATLVATRGATPLQAIILASIFEMLGPLLLGAAVADTIGGIVTVPPSVAVEVIGSGLAAAAGWNMITWRWGLPSSSGRELIAELEQAPPPFDPSEVEEAKALLAWLDDGHFTFLGFREYELVTEGGEDHLRPVEGSGLGILRGAGRRPSSGSFDKLPPHVRALARAPRLPVDPRRHQDGRHLRTDHAAGGAARGTESHRVHGAGSRRPRVTLEAANDGMR